MSDGHVRSEDQGWWPWLQGQARALGFSQIGISDVDLSEAEPGLLQWLHNGWHGDMAYMARHGLARARPAELQPGTCSVITARMDYLPPEACDGDWQGRELARLDRPQEAIISLYARGRDYHKVLRQRLQKLADALQARLGPTGHRVFTDSAPVMEVALATRSGITWRGKHTLGLHRSGGSMFFLGEIYVDRALPPTEPTSAHCGQCQACLRACPTGAIVEPYRLDARRCISYLTIEHAGDIPEALRPLIGNRIYGCDDCQLVCPWNKYAQASSVPDFAQRPELAGPGGAGLDLLSALSWTAEAFLNITTGTAIRRIGHERWQRNVVVALGNELSGYRQSGVSPHDRVRQVVQALQACKAQATPLVNRHIDWALTQAAIP